MDKLRVGLLFGGRSVEHEVSVASAASVLGALDPSRYDVRLLCVDHEGRWHLAAPGALPEAAAGGEEVNLPAVPGERTLQAADTGAPVASLDVVIPMIHGTGGEDGCVQGLLELAGVPYVGSGVLGSALQMDKEVSKRLLSAAGIPVVPGIAITSHELARDGDAIVERALREIGLPLFVKPACLGSSVGISKVETAEALLPALAEAARYDAKLLIEQAIDAREIEVAVLGLHEPEASVPGEITPKRDWYDYEAKYADDETELKIPAPVSEEQAEELRRLAVAAYRCLEGGGLGRVDFFLCRETGRIYVSEVNALPGFTEMSMFPRLWKASGLAYPALIDRLVEQALAHHRE
ncbi:MAG: D-alanine--D-alanine ligase, partial [Deltaproteobacteria bacterium]|nr:D-alanine--D-alanine ligase [Deltaproteobacteria bacterium]